MGPKGESLTLANSTRHAADRHQCAERIQPRGAGPRRAGGDLGGAALGTVRRHRPSRGPIDIVLWLAGGFFLLAGTFYLIATVIHRQHVTGQVQRNAGLDRCGRADGSGVRFAIISGPATSEACGVALCLGPRIDVGAPGNRRAAAAR